MIKFDRFVYGGFSNTKIGGNQPVYDDIWILTIPGFQWFKTSAVGTPRWAHDCALVGNRQMIVVGGVPKTSDPWTTKPAADPLTQGIGILDLSLLSWSDQYNATAPAYDSPALVKKFYGDG